MKQEKATNCNFPEHLLLEILLRLPVMSLLQFRTVSKSWNSLISTSKFITAHIDHNDANNNYDALLRCYYIDTREDAYALHSDNENLDKIMDLDFPQQTREFFYIVACVNGVVCLMDSYQRYNTVLLWNPSIRKFLTLPSPDHELSTQQLMETTLGFGFDRLSNGYKFVRIYNHEGAPKMDMFKLSTGCWTDIEFTRSSLSPARGEGATYLDGVLHWLSCDHLIVGFDLGNHTFTEMKLPKEFEKTDLHNDDEVFIGVWRGLLTAFNRQDRELYTMWTMNEYGVKESWTKLFEVRGSWRFNGITRNKGLMLFNNHSSYIDAYDPKTRCTSHNVLHLEEPLICMEITPYIESLVLLNEGENLPKLQPF